MTGNRIVVTAVIIVMVLLAPVLQAQDIDTVTDTDLHILAGTVVSLSTAAALLFASKTYEPSLAATISIAGASAIGVGIGKELIDWLGFGTPELRDMLNTTLGGVIGVTAIAFSLTAFSSELLPSSHELQYTFLMLSAALSLPVLHYIFSEEGKS